MEFYRLPVTELLGVDDGVSCLTFFITPSSLDSIVEIFSRFKDRYVLGEPELVQIPVDPKSGRLVVSGEKNLYFFVE